MSLINFQFLMREANPYNENLYFRLLRGETGPQDQGWTFLRADLQAQTGFYH
jgi:hypothetical protein